MFLKFFWQGSLKFGLLRDARKKRYTLGILQIMLISLYKRIKKKHYQDSNCKYNQWKLNIYEYKETKQNILNNNEQK